MGVYRRRVYAYIPAFIEAWIESYTYYRRGYRDIPVGGQARRHSRKKKLIGNTRRRTGFSRARAHLGVGAKNKKRACVPVRGQAVAGQARIECLAQLAVFPYISYIYMYIYMYNISIYLYKNTDICLYIDEYI